MVIMPTNLKGYIFDYRVGYVREGCVLPGFDVLGENVNNTIVALGGYTTPEQAKTRNSWADSLLESLGGSSKVKVICGCTDGYTSAQEMTRYIRDVILLKPKLVIIVSGFYNIAYKLGLVKDKEIAKILKTYPFTTPRQIDFIRYITSRFGFGNDEVYYGEKNNLPAFEYWLGHMDIINTLCSQFGQKLMICLQPCVFSGNYQISERERSEIKQLFDIDDKQFEALYTAFKTEFQNFVKIAELRDYIANFSGLFDYECEVYEDAVHAKCEFTAKLGNEIAEYCIRKALI